jgi:hypothetical protein
MNEHCNHWQDGDGDCCCCGEPNWCPDDGETPAALEQFKRRRNTCPAPQTPQTPEITA